MVVAPVAQNAEATPPTATVKEEPSFFEGLMDLSNILAVAAAGVIALLLAGWIFA